MLRLTLSHLPWLSAKEKVSSLIYYHIQTNYSDWHGIATLPVSATLFTGNILKTEVAAFPERPCEAPTTCRTVYLYHAVWSMSLASPPATHRAVHGIHLVCFCHNILLSTWVCLLSMIIYLSPYSDLSCGLFLPWSPTWSVSTMIFTSFYSDLPRTHFQP